MTLASRSAAMGQSDLRRTFIEFAMTGLTITGKGDASVTVPTSPAYPEMSVGIQEVFSAAIRNCGVADNVKAVLLAAAIDSLRQAALADDPSVLDTEALAVSQRATD